MRGRATESGSIRLIVNADDLGIAPAVNAGVLRAHAAGIVTAASLMACGGAFDDAVRRAAEHPRLDLGVHLTLVAGRPLVKRLSSLTAEPGRFLPSAGLFLQRYLAGGIRREDLALELAAQIERVCDAGIVPSHLDSHQHLHVLPGVLAVVRDLARRRRIPFVRAPFERLRIERPFELRAAGRLGGALGLRLIGWAATAALGRARDLAEAPEFLGFAAGGRLGEARLRALIARLAPGRTYELMCHPGFAPPEPEIRRWGYRHAEELAALTSPAVRADLDRRGVRLTRFADLAPG